MIEIAQQVRLIQVGLIETTYDDAERTYMYIYNMIKVSLIEVGGGGGPRGRDVKDKQRIPHDDVEKRRLADTTIIGYLLYLPSTCLYSKEN